MLQGMSPATILGLRPSPDQIKGIRSNTRRKSSGILKPLEQGLANWVAGERDEHGNPLQSLALPS